jgi:hypothetical protein
MNQLSVKLQDALGAVGFDAALMKNGEHQFLYGNSASVVAVRPLDEVTVRVLTTANGDMSYKDFDARVLERQSDEALMLLFQTLKSVQLFAS